MPPGPFQNRACHVASARSRPGPGGRRVDAGRSGGSGGPRPASVGLVLEAAGDRIRDWLMRERGAWAGMVFFQVDMVM